MPPASDPAQSDSVELDPKKDASMDERKAKLLALKKKKYESEQANRKDLAEDTNRRQATSRETARLERKRRLAESLGERIEAEETGEDLERKRNWQYSIEDNEKWDKKMAKKKSRAEFEFHNYNDAARRKYKKDVDYLKPNLSAYNKQKATNTPDQTGDDKQPSSSDLVQAASSSSTSDLIKMPSRDDNFYRDANTFIYADHRPSEDDIDRVVTKLNLDIDSRNKRSRRRDDKDEDITYINDKNKHFNKKLNRFYDKYTKEIRDNFERGTAL